MSESPLDELNAILQQLRQSHDALLDFINQLDLRVDTLGDPDVNDDFEKIQLASKKFDDLLQNTSSSSSDMHDVNTLRHIRHDLRGAVGGVIGYSEIIEDTLTDLSDHDLAKEFSTLAQKASAILPIIDTFGTTTLPATQTFDAEDSFRTDIVLGTVLIVDDSEQKRDLLKRKLKRVGHALMMASSGAEALELMEQQSPDIILLDLYMPEMNGDEVLKKLKADKRYSDIPVLMVSSSSDMDNVVKCIHLGADDYLPMPLDETLLHARLNACLTKKHARDRELAIQNELNKAQVRLKTAIDNIDEGFAVFDENDILVTYNHFFQELYPGLHDFKDKPCTYEGLLRANVEKGVFQLERRGAGNEDSESMAEDQQEDWIQRKLSYHRNPARPQLDLLSSKKWVEVIENIIPGGGVVAVHKDISKAKKKEERLEFLALHDGLTGLANRKKFDNVLTDSIAKCAKKHCDPFAIMFFDLDGFKNVNDTLGHDFGDFLLQSVAQKLVSVTRDEDLVARFGGDEFAAIITNVESISDVELVAKRCLDAVGTSVEKDNQTASFGVSIGISIYPDHGQTADEIVKQADGAMYKAKKSGKGRFCIAGE